MDHRMDTIAPLFQLTIAAQTLANVSILFIFIVSSILLQIYSIFSDKPFIVYRL